MSMLELITQASSTPHHPTPDTQHPIVINPDPIFLNLKPQPNDSSFIKRVHGWSIPQTDTDIINLSQTFFKKLKIKLKNPNSFTKDEFITLFNSHLDKINEKSNLLIRVEVKDDGYAYTKALVKNLGFLIGGSVLNLVIEACFVFEIWDLLESLIVNGLVDGSGCKDLVCKLVEKGRADLVCLCLKHVSNVGVSDVLSVLKFFLSPGKDGYGNMVGVREEWERRAVAAIETAVEMDKSVGEKKLSSAKDAAVLLTMAYDEFTASELCLHYLVASPNVDNVMFSACIEKLSGSEVMGLVRYLKKWLVKYQKFPQVGSSSKAFESVPSLEHVTKCFGLVIDEHFSSLVMHPEFREEVESVELVVNSLASEARFCCNLSNLCAGLNC